jgi:Copper amine oxidase, enzyme domain
MTEYNEVQVNIEPVGPGPEVIDEVSQALSEHPSVQEQLSETRSRLLSVELLNPEGADKADGLEPDRYRVTTYDYTNNRVILTTGSLSDIQGSMEVSESGEQPLPIREEFEEAVEILREDPDLGPKIREQRVEPQPAMPPLLTEPTRPDGRIERTLAVLLLSRSDEALNEVVGVNMIGRTVLRFPDRAPEGALASHHACGFPDDVNQFPTPRGWLGHYRVVINQADGTTLWSFLVFRPSYSLGTNGSGVTLREVDYRGKRVLYRAHAPILNVQYDNNACGPFRDWLFAESYFQADGTDVAPGIRWCTTPPRTILESGTDTGNFRGVAIYRDEAKKEVILVSELEAGYYRYISEWRLHDDGTINPRFGFSAVTNPCVCRVHHHHVYWRLDFDINAVGNDVLNNVVSEFNSPPITSSNWHINRWEVMRPRDPTRSRKWKIENSRTGEAYELIPGPDDGEPHSAASFGRGDVWILRHYNWEIDDGISAAPSQANQPQWNAPAEIGRFIGPESTYNQDIVIWYAAHFTHDVHQESGHIVGPTLQPVQW